MSHRSAREVSAWISTRNFKLVFTVTRSLFVCSGAVGGKKSGNWKHKTQKFEIYFKAQITRKHLKRADHPARRRRKEECCLGLEREMDVMRQ